MLNQRFRAIYLAAMIVFCVGLIGIVIVPKAHADPWKSQPASVSLEPNIQQRMFSSSKPLFGFATLGLASSFGLALLYSRSKV